MIFQKILLVSLAFKVSQCESVLREVYPPIDAGNGKKPLYFGLMMSLGGVWDSSGMVPAIQVALDFINNSSTSGLLSEHTLHYVLYDSQVSGTDAQHINEHLSKPPDKYKFD